MAQLLLIKKITEPIPAIAPIKAIPRKDEVSPNRIIPKIIAGKKTATIAFPTSLAFLPLTKSAVNDPTIGIQPRSDERKKIHKIALKIEPCFITATPSFFS